MRQSGPSATPAGAQLSFAADVSQLQGVGNSTPIAHGLPHPTQVAHAPAGATSGLLAATRAELAAKRVMDVLLSSLLLMGLLPLLVLTVLAVAVTSRGPVLYVQERLGAHARPFRFFKFRSMYRDAEDQQPALADHNECSGPVFKIRTDPRVTPVGRYLRRFSIDETPQLINVLRGEMSLVGPRPPLPQEYALYEPWQRDRLAVKPGLTCLWQVSGRSDVDFARWVEMDLDYIEGWSLWLDVKILLRTIPAVLGGRGAY